jgi:glycosyltransferase involved in cell wall biosynthesis
LRVAYDASPLLDPPTGVGRYTRALADALQMRGVELRKYAVALRGRATPDVKRLRVPARAARATWRWFNWPRIESLVGQIDVVHATNFVLPALKAARGIVTVHDLSFERDDVFPGGQALRKLVPWSLARAAAVITPTNAVKEELCARYDHPSERAFVTHEGVSPTFFGATRLSDTVLGRMGIPGPYILAVGTIEPRKNLRLLLHAWGAARRALDGWTLVIAGPAGWGPRLPRTDGVVLLGWTGDETLPGLMAAADVFCYPSLYEGFGLPPLEAMAAGTACVVGAYPAAEEVVGEAALIVDPRAADELTEGLVRLARDEPLRRSLALQGRARASTFTWERTAQQTLEAYRSVAGDG